MNSSRWNALLSCGICLIAVAVRSTIWLRSHDALAHDLDAYLEIAQNLVAGQGFSLGSPPHLTAYRPPLYPLLLAGLFLVGGNPWWIGGMQVVCGAITTGLTLHTGTLLGLGRYRFLAATLIAFDPLLVRYTGLPMTETLCALLVAIWCWLVVAYPLFPKEHPANLLIQKDAFRTVIRSILWGGAFGLICLCRPAFLAVPALWGIVLICHFGWEMLFPDKSGKRLQARNNRDNIMAVVQATVLFMMSLLVMLTPWIIRNGLTVGKWTPATTHGGYTLLLANNPVFYDQVVDGPSGSVWQEQSLRNWQRDLESHFIAQGLQPENEVDRDAEMYRLARAVITENPIRFARACLYRTACFWSLVPSIKASGTSIVVLILVGLFYGAVSVGVLRGLMSLNRSEWSRWLPLIVLPITLWMTHLFYWTDTRMRAPVIPVLALLAARGAIRNNWSGVQRAAIHQT